MSRLCITLLGAFRVTLDGINLSRFRTDKARALLAYLVVESHRPHRREHLAGLLWSDQPEKKALHSLRQSISTLRKILNDGNSQSPYLLVNRENVQFNPDSNFWVDVAELLNLVNQGMPRNQYGRTNRSPNIRRLQTAQSLYLGNFLDQFVLKGSPLFDEWAIIQREFLSRKIIEVMCLLVDYHERRGEYESACNIAEKIVALIPWEENAHQVIMRMLAKGGHWSAAEVQFQTLKRYLDLELGLEPSSETLTLIEAIRQTEKNNTLFDPDLPNIQSNLFHPTTSFVGRNEEMDQLWDLLINPNFRLITLTGPGGIGKSRLALQVAHDFMGIFKDGIFIVPLSAITSHDQLPVSIAEAIGFTFYAPQNPINLLLDHLRQKDMLLVLDNFEHLIATSNQSNEVISKILKSSPGVIILVTSRQPLNLRMEKVIEVQGLKYPDLDDIAQANISTDLRNFSALQFFDQIAHRVNSNFILEKNLVHVLQICQLVDGIPLGLELSANWLRGYSELEIATEIEINLDFLKTSMQDVPDRHRSMRSVFNHSWQLLNDDEKTILRNLTVFQGGFSVKAAEIVAGASPNQIYGLTDKSFLFFSDNDRYDIHNLLRQFASEKLSKNPNEYQEIQDLHCVYFANMVQEQEPALFGINPVDAQKIISIDIENIRACWKWATHHHKIEVLTKVTRSLERFYFMHSWFTEGRDVFAKTVSTLREIKNPDHETLLVIAKTSIQLGWFEVLLGNYQSAISVLNISLENLIRPNFQSISATALNVLGSAVYEQGEFERARTIFLESHEIATELNSIPEIAFANNYLGSIARNQGDFSQAKTFFWESLKQYQHINDKWESTRVLNNLGNMAGISGDYAEAQNIFEESLAFRRELDDQAGVAGCLQNLSIIAFLDKDYAKAKIMRQECLSICRQIGFAWGIASSLKHLGDVDKALGNFTQARQHYTESLEMSKRSDDRRSLAFTFNSLGSLALLQTEYPQALDYYKRALLTAVDIDVVPLIIDILIGIADLWIREGKYKEALEIIVLSKDHPGIEKQTRNRAKQLEIEVESHLSKRKVQTIIDQAHPISLHEYAKSIVYNKSD